MLLSVSLMLLSLGNVYASQSLGDVSSTMTGSVGLVARFLTAACYVVGFGFGVGSIVKLKAHRDSPSQIPLSQPVFIGFIALLLIFAPLLFSVMGNTIFGASAQTGSAIGVTTVK
jgi:intracellular multiplication protein IcmD